VKECLEGLPGIAGKRRESDAESVVNHNVLSSNGHKNWLEAKHALMT
jgi:hypothetical protein